jgi:hypothetical protein
MMPGELTRPFETIESALEFMVLLEGVTTEVSADLQDRLQLVRTGRQKNGLDLALYKIHQLSSHVQKSRRILNDLALIKRVLIAHDRPSVINKTEPDGPQSACDHSELLRLNNGLENQFPAARPAKEQRCDALSLAGQHE